LLGFNSQQGQGIFVVSTTSRSFLEPNQPISQWVMGALSVRVKLPWCEADHLPPSGSKAKTTVKLYGHSLTDLHGKVFN
jgi:hypothetical protein